MASSNTSYIDEASTYTELWELLDRRHIHGLVSEDDSETVTSLSLSPTAEQLGRLNMALNWGMERVEAGLSEKYDMSIVTKANAPLPVKGLNARYAQWWLEWRRYRNAEALTSSMEEIDAELEQYARERTHFKLDLTKRSSPIGGKVDSKATDFDAPNQFDKIIPDRERDDVWPSGVNEA